MKRLIYFAAALCAALFLSACDNEGSREADAYDRQMALDKGDYQKVLEMTASCGSDQACLVDRAAAFMGIAGFTAAKVAKALVSKEQKSGEKSYFSLLSKTLHNGSDGNLTKSKDHYELAISARGYNISFCDAAHSSVLNKLEKDSCANSSLASIVKSAVLADKVLEIAKNAGGYEACALNPSSCVNGDVEAAVSGMVDLLFNDTDLLIDLIDLNADSSVKEQTDKIKGDVCEAAGKPRGCAAADIDASNSAQLEGIFVWILEHR